MTSGMIPASTRYLNDRRNHWDTVALEDEGYKPLARYYHRRLETLLRFFAGQGKRVLEIGCAEGNLLNALDPAFGVGVDISQKMIHQAKDQYPHLHFIQADGHRLPFAETFDVILLSDLLNDIWDVQELLAEVHRVSHPQTRILINSYNRLWELVLALANRLNLARSNLFQNWLTIEDIHNLLSLTEFELIRHSAEVLWPFGTPLLSSIANKIFVRLWPFTHLGLTNLIIARPRRENSRKVYPSLSIIVPARNEAGNIRQLLNRLPELKYPTELIFVEGHSRDGTYEAIEEAIREEKRWRCKLLQQSGEGKGDAVREGFNQASGDILIILDADLTVSPEDIPRFVEALVSGKAEFANGVRLVYPMQDEAMRFFNLIGNKFFSLAFTWLLGQPIKDTLCGTKAIWRAEYGVIARDREYFGKIDPFGDFDLLLGAAKLNLKIVDIPIRYNRRTYGSTNIARWRHGFLLLHMMVRAARKIKFV